MRERFQAISLTEEVRSVMLDTHTELEDYNKQQLSQGKRKDGSAITPEYSPMTIFLKQQKGQPWDRVTLYDEGNYYDRITLSVDAQTYDLHSTDSKAAKLLAKYGDDIEGLTEDNKNDYRATTLKPRTVEAICNRTGAIAI